MSHIIKKGLVFFLEKTLFKKKWKKSVLFLIEDGDNHVFIVFYKNITLSTPIIDGNTEINRLLKSSSNKIIKSLSAGSKSTSFSDAFKLQYRCPTDFGFTFFVNSSRKYYICVDSIDEFNDWSTCISKISENIKSSNHSIKSAQIPGFLSSIQRKLRYSLTKTKKNKKSNTNSDSDQIEQDPNNPSLIIDKESTNTDSKGATIKIKYPVHGVNIDPPKEKCDGIVDGFLEFTDNELMFRYEISGAKEGILSWTYDSIKRYGVAKNVFTIDTVAKLNRQRTSTTKNDGKNRIYKFYVTHEKQICDEFILFAKRYAEMSKNASTPAEITPAESNLNETEKQKDENEYIKPNISENLGDKEISNGIKDGMSSEQQLPSPSPVPEVTKIILTEPSVIDHQFSAQSNVHYINISPFDKFDELSASGVKSPEESNTTHSPTSTLSFPLKTVIYKDKRISLTSPIYITNSNNCGSKIISDESSNSEVEHSGLKNNVEIVQNLNKKQYIITSQVSPTTSIPPDVFESYREPCTEFKSKLTYFEQLNGKQKLENGNRGGDTNFVNSYWQKGHKVHRGLSDPFYSLSEEK